MFTPEEVLDYLRGVACELDGGAALSFPMEFGISLKVGSEVAEDNTQGFPPQSPSMVVVGPRPPTPLRASAESGRLLSYDAAAGSSLNANGTSKRQLAAGMGAEAEKSAEGQTSTAIVP